MELTKSTFWKQVAQRFNDLVESSEASVAAYGAQYDGFCLFFLVNYVLVFNHWALVGPYPYAVLWTLRLLACFFTLVLFLRNRWPESLQKYLPLYWFFVLFYCLSFRTVSMVLYSEHTTAFKYFGVMGLIFMAVLVDSKVFTVLLTLGVILGVPFFYLTGGALADPPSTTTLFFAGYGYLGCIVLKLVFSRNNEIAFQKRLSDLRLWAGSIAHEVRGPVVTMTLALDGLKTQMGVLTEGYDYACRTGYEGPRISPEQQEQLQVVVDRFSNIANRAFMTIELLLAEAQNRSSRGVLFSVVDCVKKTVQNFPFLPGESELFNLDLKSDCVLTGKFRLFSLLLDNLVGNSLDVIRSSKKGQIEISTSQTKSHFEVRIKDTASGISPKNLPRIFDDFFTTKANGTGIGLAISKRIVELHGGQIHCDSIEGQYAEFICRFPLKITKMRS